MNFSSQELGSHRTAQLPSTPGFKTIERKVQRSERWILKYRLSYSFIVMENNKSMQISWAILYFQIESNENAFRNLVNMPS